MLLGVSVAMVIGGAGPASATSTADAGSVGFDKVTPKSLGVQFVGAATASAGPLTYNDVETAWDRSSDHGHTQANSEARYRPEGQWQSNGHLDIDG